MKRRPNINAQDLASNFRQAKNKREQIQIEADLNCCSAFEIAEVLNQLGALDGTGINPMQFSADYVPVAPAPTRKRKRATIDEAYARHLWDNGVTIYGMAERLGVSRAAVYDWAKRRGLQRRQPTRESETKEEKELTIKTESKAEPGADAPDAPVPDDEAQAFEPGPIVPGDTWDGYVVPQPAREELGVTVARFLDVFHRCLTESMADAELRINGAAVEALGFDIRVRNEQVFVDLRTKEAG